MRIRRGSGVFDDRIAELPEDKKLALRQRYSSLSSDPDHIKIINRIVAHSRMVGLNHPAGLSTPRQIQMFLMANCALVHKDELRQRLVNLIHRRLDDLWLTAGFLLPAPYRVGYYSEIVMMVWGKKIYGQVFRDYLKKNYDPLDFVFRLAEEHGVV